jgi:hypothetical protein
LVVLSIFDTVIKNLVFMVSVVGTYLNGYLKLDKDYSTKNPVKVIVTFLEEVQGKSEEGLVLSDFSFSRSKQNLQNYHGSFADTVIDERRSEL